MPGIRDKHRKIILGVFTGEEFHIRRIRPSEFMQVLGALPAESSKTLAIQLNAMKESLLAKANEPGFENRVRDFYLQKGVTSPPLFFGPYEECPEDSIHVDDLGDDATVLVNAIAEMSFGLAEFKKKMGQLHGNQQPSDDRPDSEAIREVADADTPAGNGADPTRTIV